MVRVAMSNHSATTPLGGVEIGNVIVGVTREHGGDGMATQVRDAAKYRGYKQRDEGISDIKLTQTGPGTPGGEYLRRFWHPVCYESELGALPLSVRALGE